MKLLPQRKIRWQGKVVVFRNIVELVAEYKKTSVLEILAQTGGDIKVLRSILEECGPKVALLIYFNKDGSISRGLGC
jgi:hypothetical protein